MQHPSNMLDLSHELGALQFFEHCTRASISELCKHSSLLDLPEGQMLFSEGEKASHVYILLHGLVRVFHQHHDGREVTVKHLAHFCTFGEMEILAEETYYLESAATQHACRLLKVSKAVFLKLLADEPGLCRIFLHDICARFCVAARNERSIFFDVDKRIAALLLSYGELFGQEHEKGFKIAKELTQQQIAQSLGITVRSVARTFEAWKKIGLVVRSKGWLILCDRQGLEELCGDLHHHLNYRLNQL